jgi:hypothetical protein
MMVLSCVACTTTTPQQAPVRVVACGPLVSLLPKPWPSHFPGYHWACNAQVHYPASSECVWGCGGGGLWGCGAAVATYNNLRVAVFHIHPLTSPDSGSPMDGVDMAAVTGTLGRLDDRITELLLVLGHLGVSVTSPAQGVPAGHTACHLFNTSLHSHVLDTCSCIAMLAS